MYVRANTIDDILRRVLRRLLRTKERISPRKGDAYEIRGALLKLTNPRARLSTTETKGIIFSALGELLWYLSGADEVANIAYYLGRYREAAETDGRVHGAYGPRLFNLRGINQIQNVIDALRRRDSRQAVIQIFAAEDIAAKYNDVPCTCTMQFFSRGGKLDLMVTMRSNDAFVGLPHDIFAFTMIQEIVAKNLGLKLGEYSHAVGSLHLYESDRPRAQTYMSEGWQDHTEMPEMPTGNPWPEISHLLSAEAALREGKAVSAEPQDPYWRDLYILLRIFALTRTRTHVPVEQLREVIALKGQMSSRFYESYIRKRQRKVESVSTDLLLVGT